MANHKMNKCTSNVKIHSSCEFLEFVSSQISTSPILTLALFLKLTLILSLTLTITITRGQKIALNAIYAVLIQSRCSCCSP